MTITDENLWLAKRKSYVTSTESSSLFGLQMPSLPTAFELYHIKISQEVDPIFNENERMIWGRRLEDVIAKGVAEDNNWTIEPLKVFAYDDDDKIGSSFDYKGHNEEKGQFLIEIKTVAYRDYKMKFVEDDDSDFIEAPAYYEVQVQHELECIGEYEWCALVVFIMDTRDVKILWRKRDRDMGAKIRAKIRHFWLSGEIPAPDLEADSDLLARMQRANNSDKTLDATEISEFDLYAQAYLDETLKSKQADLAKKRARSQMLLLMDDYNQAWCNVARVTNKSSFRVTETKGK